MGLVKWARLQAGWQQHYAPLFPYVTLALTRRADDLEIQTAELELPLSTLDSTSELGLIEAVFHEVAHAMVFGVSHDQPWEYTTHENLKGNFHNEWATQWVVYRAFRAAKIRAPHVALNFKNAQYRDVRRLKTCPRPTDEFEPTHPLLLKLHEDMVAVLAKYRQRHPTQA